MKRGFNRRALPLLLALWLLVVQAPLPVRAAPEEDAGPDTAGAVLTISSVEELLDFAAACALDAWSQGKTVALTADLDLSGVDFTPIPTFGGTLLGQGHTISNLRIAASGSNQGLFRYLQPGALVQDLTLTAEVAPGGSRSTVGAIAGVNAGTVRSCTVSASVQGESAVGGIAGRNEGEISYCTVSGSVSGESAVGGIAGRNLGLLLKCTNRAGVNLTQREAASTLAGLEAGTARTETSQSGGAVSRLLDGWSDTGGIAGFSGGVIQSCTNRGDVGYPHVGYNTGGIAGRQNGYLAGCVNTGRICGRKDVGGIAGQAEPYVVMDPGRDTIEELRRELNTLEKLINRALDDAQRTGDSVSAQLTAMGDYAGSAKDSAKEMLDRVSDFADENIDTINTLTADLTAALDRASPALDDLSDVGRRLERMSRQLGRAMDDLGGAVDTGDRMLRDLRTAAGELRDATAQLTGAVTAVENALNAFHRFLSPGSWGISWGELDTARSDLRQAFSALRGAGDELDGALSRLQLALSRSGALSNHLGDALEELEDASDSAALIGRLLRQSMDTLGDAVDGLTANGPAQFTPLGEGFRLSGDSLYQSLNGLFDEMEGLNSVLQGGNTSLTGDLRAISRQCNVVFTLLLDAMSDLLDDAEAGLDGLVQDTSEEDISATREGKLADCSNTGAVEGDRNVGGIAGSMAIEFDLDPEDDATDRFTFGATYETKAVLENCLNRGSVTAKKDCAGGIVGRMDLGTALGCQSYGPASSTGGDYVGGVAGWADASVRGCYAKCTLSGGSYVGGIAGWASRLRDCCAIATVTGGTECLGAVAGGVDSGGVLSGNRFVDTGLAGVDGVSYAGRAEPVAFDTLTQLPGLPVEFTAFTLTLTAEGETVARLPFFYGDDLSRLELPPVPEQEDSYGRWPAFDTTGLRSDLTVEAVYTPWVTVVASAGRSGKRSLALAEGRFTEEAVLQVTDSPLQPPEGSGADALVWDVSLTGTGLTSGDTVPLRLLAPSQGDAAVWQYRDGQWQAVEARRSGQYLLLSMTGTEGSFCLQPQAGTSWLLVPGAALLLALLGLAAASRRRKKVKRSAEQSAEKPEEKPTEKPEVKPVGKA